MNLAYPGLPRVCAGSVPAPGWSSLVAHAHTGRLTLAEHLVSGERRYESLDDLDVLVGGVGPLTLDEVQREPALLRAVKRAIDRDRAPGRLLLTGSANLLLMRRVSESLTGRASYLTLWPMTRREQRGLGRAGIWDTLLEIPDREWRDLLAAEPDTSEDWRALARRGGFPTPAIGLAAPRERAEVCYWRTTIGEEVDFVVEAAGKLLPIEVKAGAKPTLADASNLRVFRAEYGNRARAGLLLHTGSRLEWLTPDVLAAPWWRVL